MNTSAYSPESAFYSSAQVYCTTAVGQQDSEVGLAAAPAHDYFLETLPSLAGLILPSAVAYYSDVTSQVQGYMPEPFMTPDLNYHAVAPASEPFLPTLDAGEWSSFVDSMPYATTSPTWDPTSSSLYMALQQLAPPTSPPMPQPTMSTMSPLDGFANLSLQPDDVSPAMLQKALYEDTSPYIPQTPQLFYSSPSAPSSPSSSHESHARTSDPDYSLSPSSKRASKKLHKGAKAPASPVQRISRKRPASLYSPYSSSPSSPASSSSAPSDTSLFRTAKVKTTAARTIHPVDPSHKIEPEFAGPRAWRCPHCDYVQENGHKAELRRHADGHYPDSPRRTLCRGLPVAPEDLAYALEHCEDVQEYGGRLWRGGCWKEFCRPDALKRHLSNTNNTCVGVVEQTSKGRKRRDL